MGVLNVTPDSFSDGGKWLGVQDAVRHGLELRDQGADIVDVGGESTRPGASRTDHAQELARVVPVVRQLTEHGVVVSIDTMRSQVAAAAVEVGASIVNDVSGGLADPLMAGLVADLGVAMVAMHWRGHSHDMTDRATYDDVVSDVRAELADRVAALVGAGIARDALVLDPGLGFAKTAAQNWTVLRGLSQLQSLGLPILVGASRKGFLAHLGALTPVPADRREGATTALTVMLAQSGVWGVRVHDVLAARTALGVLQTMAAAAPSRANTMGEMP